MKSNKIIDRTAELKQKLNDFLTDITCQQKDYFNTLTANQLIDLKMALTDVHNIMTLKITLALCVWIKDYFKLSDEEYNVLINDINKINPNTNGFDIHIPTRELIAEIKSTVPINNGDYYGAAQRNSILDDAIKLIKGKKSVPNTSNYKKIIGVLDLGVKTDNAIRKLMTEAKNINTENKVRIERHKVVSKLKVIDDKMLPNELTTDFVYIKKVTIN